MPPPVPPPSTSPLRGARYEDPSRCVACLLIHRWEASRRKTLEVLERKGVIPWYGAWRVRPEAYVPDINPLCATAVLPVVQPGESLGVAPLLPLPTHPHHHHHYHHQGHV
jgi:hypothetical protein